MSYQAKKPKSGMFGGTTVLVAGLGLVLLLVSTHSFSGLSNWRTFNDTGLKLSHNPSHFSEAENMFNAALRDGQFFCVPETELTAVVINLADLYVQEGKPMKAMPYYRRALKGYERGGVIKNAEIAHCLVGLAKGLAWEERYKDAIPVVERARAILARSIGQGSAEFNDATVNLAYIKSKAGDVQGASELLSDTQKSKS